MPINHHSRKSASNFIFLMLIFCAFSSVARAANLTEYKKKIHRTKETIYVLLYADEEKSEAEIIKNEQAAFNQLRANLPVSEKVEWKNESIEIDNSWILENLEAFEKEKDSTKRWIILNGISERLGAIEIKIDELEKASAIERTKDEDKQKLAEILSRAEYRKPEEKKESFLERKWREFKEWLDEYFPKAKMGEPSPGIFESVSFVLQIIIYAVVAGIIGFLIYRFAPFLRQRFKGRVKTDKGARVILGEELAADETSDNLFAEAEKLAREGNLRAAIRKGYIAFLCELSDRKIIGLAQHKTNRDYLRDVKNRAELHQNMKGLTGSFERHWYGLSSTDETDWEEFRRNYNQAVGKAH
ncbi:MAG: DUF4129 domain-containing protein [Pyrinomonadaceae bacterium]